MKEFACGDLVPGCDAHFARATEDEVLADVAAHAAEAHGMTEVPPQMVADVRARITTA